ncbi:unnamed protein product [Phaeothamnion confervicola]
MASTAWLAIVTGASRGFGRAIALELVATAAKRAPLHLVLLARGATGLDGTAAAARQESSSVAGNRHPLTIETQVLDLGDLDVLEARFQEILKRTDPRVYARSFLINNAGSLGPLCGVRETPSLAVLRAAFDFNVTSCAWLTAAFARAVTATGAGAAAGAVASDEGAGPSVIINVSSLAAIQPFETWGAYCAGKAARDMWHATLPKELSNTGKSSALTVLSYAPGAMDTDMQTEVRASSGCDPELAEAFRRAHIEGNLVDPRDSAAKCVRLAVLNPHSFAPGAHADYHDRMR